MIVSHRQVGAMGEAVTEQGFCRGPQKETAAETRLFAAK